MRIKPYALEPVLLAAWSSNGLHESGTTIAHVLPDGCQDLIWMQRAGERPVWFIAPLTAGPYAVMNDRPVHYRGYRIRPGTMLASADLLDAAERCGGEGEPQDVLPLLDAHARRPLSVVECLDALACRRRVDHAARSLGVSVRTLARTVERSTGYPPVFWCRLARIRTAAHDLVSAARHPHPGRGLALAELAANHGFSDQAHFSRECRGWLGFSPRDLRARTDLHEVVLQSGYGSPGIV